MNAPAKQEKPRCTWAGTDPLMQQYHDHEWGSPESQLPSTSWELLMLEGFQAGLSWITVLRKRVAFRAAFRQFDPVKIARYKRGRHRAPHAEPQHHPRPRQGVKATINGARINNNMRDSGINCAAFAWHIAGGKPIKKRRPRSRQHPALRNHLERTQTARLQVRRPHHRLCLDAGLRHSPTTTLARLTFGVKSAPGKNQADSHEDLPRSILQQTKMAVNWFVA